MQTETPQTPLQNKAKKSPEPIKVQGFGLFYQNILKKSAKLFGLYYLKRYLCIIIIKKKPKFKDIKKQPMEIPNFMKQAIVDAHELKHKRNIKDHESYALQDCFELLWEQSTSEEQWEEIERLIYSKPHPFSNE